MSDEDDDSIKGILEELIEIPSIGELTARVLVKNGYDSVSKLKELDVEDLTAIDEIGDEKANRIIEEIKGEIEDSKDVISEIICVNCHIIVDVDKDVCEECGEEISIKGAVIIPDEGMIEEPKEMLAGFERDLMDGKESSEIWYGRGAILDNMGYKWEALRSYNKVIEHDPLYDHIWNAKARAALEIGKVRDAAKAYKVAFDTHVANSPIKALSTEKPKIRKEKKEIGKRELSVKEVENKLFMARSVIHELREKEIDLSELNKLLDEAVESRNNDDRRKAVSTAEKIIHSAGVLREIFEVIGQIEGLLEELSGYEFDVEEFESQKESLIEKVETGEFETTLDRSYDLLDEVEDTLDEEKLRLKEKKEKEERLNESIQEIKELIKDIRTTRLNIDEYKEDFSEVVNDKKEERYTEGLEKIDDLRETGEVIKDTHGLLKELKEKVEESKFTLEEFGYKDEIQNILDLGEDGLYHEAFDRTSKLLESYEERLKELEAKEELKGEFSQNVTKLKEKFSELKETSLNHQMIKSMILDARELKEEEDYDEGISVLKEAIDKTEKLLDFSEEYERTKELIKELNRLNLEYEPYKDRLKPLKEDAENGKLEDVFEEIDELIIDIETDIDETVSKREERLTEHINELSEIIKEGKDKEIQMDTFEQNLEDAKAKRDEEEYYDGLEILEGLIEKAETKIHLEPILYSVNETIDEISEDIDVSEFKERISKIRSEFDQGDYEESLKMADDLQEAVINRKEEWEKEQELIEEFDEKLSIVNQNLSECKDTKINVGDVKELLDEAVTAKEGSDYEAAIDKLDQALETSERVLRIYEMLKEGADKIRKLKEYDMDYKEYLEHLKDCRKMADVNIYDKAEMILEDALDDMDEELIELGEETLEEVAEESRDELEAMEEELSRSYEKLRNDVEDLKELYYLSDEFDIQVGMGRKLLKITIKNIREADYKKAIKHLEKGEDKIVESIEERIDEMIGHVESKLTSVEDEEKIDKVEELLDFVEDSRQNGEYRESLENLNEAKDMLKDIKEIDIDEKISSLEELIDDAEEAGMDVEESKELTDDLREMEEAQEEGLEEKISTIEEEISESINLKIKNKVEKAKEELEQMDIEDSEKSKPINLLTKATKAQSENDLKKALSFITDYQEMVEEGLEDSED